jgi:hypothetical protein
MEWLLMSEIKTVWITTRWPSERDPAGAGEQGHYIVTDGMLQMVTEAGRPAGKKVKLWPDDDPARIARRLTKEAHARRTKENSFHRQIVYPPWRPA